MSDAPAIDLARHDAVAVISLRRPERRNAVNAAWPGRDEIPTAPMSL
jgi:enoyl-CoA hydratase/carnithine racemase